MFFDTSINEIFFLPIRGVGISLKGYILTDCIYMSDFNALYTNKYFNISLYNAHSNIVSDES